LEASPWNSIAKYIIKEKSSPTKFRRLINQIERAKFECEHPFELERKRSLMNYLKKKMRQKRCVDTVQSIMLADFNRLLRTGTTTAAEKVPGGKNMH
jgi:hypothetical protein